MARLRTIDTCVQVNGGNNDKHKNIEQWRFNDNSYLLSAVLIDQWCDCEKQLQWENQMQCREKYK